MPFFSPFNKIIHTQISHICIPMRLLLFEVADRFYCCCWFLPLVLAFFLLVAVALLEAARHDATAARNVREPGRS